jgi:hypothetical protein
MRRLLPCLLAVAVCFAVSRSLAVSEEPAAPDADAMKKWAEAAKLGKHHKDLEYYLGTWDGAIELLMPGMPAMPPEKVVATGAWAIEGRWMSWRVKGTMMGMPFEGFGVNGFDNVKKAHVSSWVSNLDTALTHATGPVVDPAGKIVSMYGTIDEYTTGELDKPVRVTTKRISQDQFVYEIADLGIGETGAVVLRQTFTRRKS